MKAINDLTNNYYLVFSPYTTDCVNGAVMLDYSINLLEKDLDCKILFIYLDEKLSLINDVNIEGSKIRQYEVSFDNHILIKKYKNERIKFFPLSSFIKSNINITYNFNSLDDVKTITYRDINIGYGVVASLVSFFRNINPIINDSTKQFISGFLNSVATIVQGLLNITSLYPINYMCTFNGRFATMKPPVEVAKKLGIPFLCIELCSHNSYADIKYLEFRQHLPHSIENATKRIEQVWRSVNEQDIKAAHNFFINRSRGVRAGDKVYTTLQEENLLPEKWNPNKRNFVFFTSSEDEFFSIGEEWEALKLFKNQEEAIRTISQICKKDKNVEIYVRIHPNLMNLPYSYARFESLKSCSNVSIIPPESKISSYYLLKQGEKCLSSGSTMGVEATYWGIPSILMGPSQYYYLDVAYVPKNLSELETFLINNLSPKSRQNALKYVYGIYNTNHGNVPKLIDFIPKPIKFRGKELEIPRVMKLFGSSLIFNFSVFIFRVLNLYPKYHFKKTILNNFLQERK